MRKLRKDDRFPDDVVSELERLPGFRSILIHEYVALDMARVLEAVDKLEPVERFLATVREIVEESAPNS